MPRRLRYKGSTPGGWAAGRFRPKSKRLSLRTKLELSSKDTGRKNHEVLLDRGDFRGGRNWLPLPSLGPFPRSPSFVLGLTPYTLRTGGGGATSVILPLSFSVMGFAPVCDPTRVLLGQQHAWPRRGKTSLAIYRKYPPPCSRGCLCLRVTLDISAAVTRNGDVMAQEGGTAEAEGT